MPTAHTDRREDRRRTRERPSPHDFLSIEAHLSKEELQTRDDVRRFVREKIDPNIPEWWEHAIFPREIVPEMGNLGLLGMHLSGYGCAGRSAVEYGLACLELEAGDSGLRTFVSVQGSLAMSAIHKFGSEEHKQEWLLKMAKGEAVRSEEHTSELQSRQYLVCRLLLEKKKRSASSRCSSTSLSFAT